MWISSKYRSEMWGVVWTTLARLFCQHFDWQARSGFFRIPVPNLYFSKSKVQVLEKETQAPELRTHLSACTCAQVCASVRGVQAHRQAGGQCPWLDLCNHQYGIFTQDSLILRKMRVTTWWLTLFNALSAGLNHCLDFLQEEQWNYFRAC